MMITGDNRLTAAAIAKEAGVDDFIAEAKPEDKLALIRGTGLRTPGGHDGRCAPTMRLPWLRPMWVLP